MNIKKSRNRIIKKYQNRRLYDVATSSYLIFEDIKQLIVDGEKIQVIDSKGNDITKSVLLQIILEEETNGIPMFSTDFMFQIIRFYGKIFQPSLSPFFEHVIELFMQMQKKFHEEIKNSYSREKILSKAELWEEFIIKQEPHLELTIRNQAQDNINNFLIIQENLSNQTEPVYSEMPLQFNTIIDDK